MSTPDHTGGAPQPGLLDEAGHTPELKVVAFDSLNSCNLGTPIGPRPAAGTAVSEAPGSPHRPRPSWPKEVTRHKTCVTAPTATG
jgi:hypothetical protein